MVCFRRPFGNPFENGSEIFIVLCYKGKLAAWLKYVDVLYPNHTVAFLANQTPKVIIKFENFEKISFTTKKVLISTTGGLNVKTNSLNKEGSGSA